ncbi:hypothetical protein CR513_33390, partial [Mucuna pruriens]
MLGAVLGRRVARQQHVIAYASRTMDPSQINYTIIEKEFVEVPVEEAKCEVKTDSVDASLSGIRLGDQRQERCRECSSRSSELTRERVDPLSIRDEFLDEQILQLEKVKLWYADICNFLVASTNSQVYFGSRDLVGPPFLSFSIRRRPLWIDSNSLESPRLWTPMNLSQPANNVKEQEWPSAKGMKCPNSRFYYVKWVEAKATKTNDAKVVVEFGVPRALINDQGNHFYNHTMSTLLKKYGVVHKVAIVYHPQTNGLAEVFNREIKKLLQKMECLPTGSSLVKPTTYRLKLNIEPTKQSRSAICPMTKRQRKETIVAGTRGAVLGSLRELLVKQFHDNRILRKEFRVGQKLKAGKLRSRWDDPFVITNMFSYGAVELRGEANNRNFKVNGHQIKPYHEGPTLRLGEERKSASRPDEVVSARRVPLLADSVSSRRLRLRMMTLSPQADSRC